MQATSLCNAQSPYILRSDQPTFIYHNNSNVNRTTARTVLQSPRPCPSWHRAVTYLFIFIERNHHINWSSKQGLSITITQASWMPIQGCHDAKQTVLWARSLISTWENYTGYHLTWSVNYSLRYNVDSVHNHKVPNTFSVDGTIKWMRC